MTSLSVCGKPTVVWGNQADKPVYEEDGSLAHVSWCPCYPCHIERTFCVCNICGKCVRLDVAHGCKEGRRP